MKVFVRRTSDIEWYAIENFETIESLFDFINNHGGIIVQENSYYHSDPQRVAKCWDDMTIEDAEIITNCVYEVEIYDTWRE